MFFSHSGTFFIFSLTRRLSRMSPCEPGLGMAVKAALTCLLRASHRSPPQHCAGGLGVTKSPAGARRSAAWDSSCLPLRAAGANLLKSKRCKTPRGGLGVLQGWCSVTQEVGLKHEGDARPTWLPRLKHSYLTGLSELQGAESLSEPTSWRRRMERPHRWLQARASRGRVNAVYLLWG